MEKKTKNEPIASETALRYSEDRFNAAMQVLNGTLWTTSSSGEIVGVQPGWEILTGQSYDQYKGYGWALVVHPDDAEPTIEAWKEAVLEKKIFKYSHRLRLKNGEWGRFAIKAIPLFNEDGSIREWVGVHTNITREKEFEEELQRQVNERTIELQRSKSLVEEAAARLLAVFESAQSGLFIFSPVFNDSGEVVDFTFVITNPTFAAYVGQAPQMLNGERGSKWFPGYLTNGVFDMYKQTYVTGKVIRQEMHYHVDGHDLYLDLMSTKVGEEVLVTFTDHTQLSRMQIELQRTIQELKRSNNSLEAFAYAASHDLKQPIRKIRMFSTRLKESLAVKMNDVESKWLERINDASERMMNLIDDLLSYSRVTLETGLPLESIDLNELLAGVLNDLEVEIESKGATINLGHLPTITGYKQQIIQAFQNLISNSIKYSRPGVPPVISIKAEKSSRKEMPIGTNMRDLEKEYYVFTLIDNGIGFETSDGERIFSVFTRLHNEQQFSGTGVGLAIVQKVVEHHGGYITADGVPMEGATFRMFLPVRSIA